MRTKEQTKEIANLAGTTPEIVEAVLCAYFECRYVIVKDTAVSEAEYQSPSLLEMALIMRSEYLE